MRGLITGVLAAVVLAGCATMTVAPAGSESSMIIGELTLDVSGVGTADNGADGMVNTNVPYASEIDVQSEASGKTYQLRTDLPSGFFSLANAEPGTYSLARLWAQVRTPNSYVTITSSFSRGPTFEVAAGGVTNLGVNHWTFTFDLTWGTSTNAFTFNADYPEAAAALSRADSTSAWASRPSAQVALSGEIAAVPQAVPLQPRGSAERILIP